MMRMVSGELFRGRLRVGPVVVAGLVVCVVVCVVAGVFHLGVVGVFGGVDVLGCVAFGSASALGVGVLVLGVGPGLDSGRDRPGFTAVSN